MKKRTKEEKQRLVAALGNGHRQAQLAKGNGGFERVTAVHQSKKIKKPKYPKKYLDVSVFCFIFVSSNN